jgi:hypothetical protein
LPLAASMFSSWEEKRVFDFELFFASVDGEADDGA